MNKNALGLGPKACLFIRINEGEYSTLHITNKGQHFVALWIKMPRIDFLSISIINKSVVMDF